MVLELTTLAIFVRVVAGAIQLTRIPLGANCWDNERVSVMRAVLTAP